MKASSVIKLNQTALQSNWEFLRSFFKGKQISAVVKGNAYGHGITAYVPMAEACGVNHFAVFNAGEAYEVYEVASPSSTIMIMGSLDDDDIEWAIEKDIEFYVFTMERLATAINTAAKLNKKALIHIEIETGMYRTGFEQSTIPELITHLKNNTDTLVFKGLCMHFAGAESIANYVRVKKQKISFKKALKVFKEAGIMPEIIHTCCSAAAVRLPDMHYDMIRIGIMQYGFWSGPEVLIEYLNKYNVEESPLKRILSWESTIMSIKEVPPGEFIGYGATFFSHQTMLLAIVPVGYAHGFSRSLSNTGIVLINGRRAPVVGMVNMNCIAIDVTNMSDVKINDTVILIGMQGGHEVSVASFGEMSNQLNYELLTRLPINIERKMV
ncbi:alanine racemase [Flavobacterium arcticum]|uniref:Alanine racemase n=1 Tax=Flavobacterium arcticum TaxID=1784713 RepID=A0A345H921_9FLAO|nr:alanine racemase [Flavobacterium arcticum]AXG73081.1 alanine racemase [Flavobacterium arcticum]KAF2512872.1 alanine racemase [Flavobacterium arcticum]